MLLPKEGKNMVEKFKNYLKKNFSNSPKAKIITGLILALVLVTAMIISMRKTVNVSIDGEEHKIVTYKRTVEGVLEDYNLNEKDKVEPSLESKISNDDTIEVKRSVPVNITVADKNLEIFTAEDTVGEMLNAENTSLKDEGINYKDGDLVTPSKDTAISKDMNIQVVNVEEETVIQLEKIPFETEQIVDYNQLDTYRQVTKPGVEGEKEVTYTLLKYNGEVVSNKKVGERPIKEPQNESVTVGGSTLKVSRSGESYKSKKTMFMESTAYTGGGLTATGRRVVFNPDGISTIAVDPSVIPLGSLVEVAGYGRAIAADTGGLIKGNIIDVYLDSSSECNSWGRKYGVEVNIIAYPGEW